jgi:hypothetical protein
MGVSTLLTSGSGASAPKRPCADSSTAGVRGAEWVAKSAVRSVDEVRARIDTFRETGADELIFSPSVPDVHQVDLLADAAGLTL